jgi:hypothetical protein
MIIGMLDALVAVVVSLGTHNIFYGLTAAVLAHIAVAVGVVFVEAARGLRTSWHR